MQDPSVYSQIKEFPDQEHLKCPRCDSDNTKFCYYNNYNLSQPRHFCKNCRRYWTKGGALRNVPVGGGSRKSSTAKRSAPSSPTADSSAAKRPAPSKSDENPGSKNGDTNNMPLIGEGQFGDFSSVLVEPDSGQDVDPCPGQDQDQEEAGLEEVNADGFLNDHGGEAETAVTEETGTTECWSGNSNVWPGGLSIYTPPGSTFH